VLLGALLAATGCVLFGGGSGTQPLAFSHKIHVDQEGMDCTDCHAGVETSDEPGMPALAGCNLCHQQIDADKPPERGAAARYDGARYRTTAASALPGEVRFSHQQHVAKVQECNACHAGIATSEAVGASVAVTKAACLACHERRGVDGACATCHLEVRSDRPPRTHTGLWLRQHGSTVRGESQAIVDRCEMCHDDGGCQACHRSEPPASHNNFFRRRGHGLLARMDRDGCAVCHRPDSCDSCHRQVLPANHTGSFGGQRSTHCVSCHLPLESTDCATCHRSTPSHALAAPLPPGHVPSMNCRQCHGLTAPLPHVDKGDQCTACHR